MSRLAAIAIRKATANEISRDSFTAARKLPYRFTPRGLPIMVCIPSPILPRCLSKADWIERFMTAVLMTPVKTMIKRKATSILAAQRLRMALNIFSLFIFEAVTSSPHSFDELFSKLLPKMADVNIHHAQITKIVIPPYFFQKLLA